MLYTFYHKIAVRVKQRTDISLRILAENVIVVVTEVFRTVNARFVIPKQETVRKDHLSFVVVFRRKPSECIVRKVGRTQAAKPSSLIPNRRLSAVGGEIADAVINKRFTRGQAHALIPTRK